METPKFEPEKMEFDFEFLQDDDFQEAAQTIEDEVEEPNYSNNGPSIRRRKNYIEITTDDEPDCTSGYENLNFVFQTIMVYVAVMLSCFLMSWLKNYLISGSNRVDLEYLRTYKFPSQDAFLWDVLEMRVQEVKTFKRPSTLIFLYEKEAESTVERLIEAIGKFAVCNITDCSKTPLVLTDDQLNFQTHLNYYRLIEKYREDVKSRGVMIVKNLENVGAAAARSFYNFCDKTSPVVRRSLYIFTIKVAKFEKDNKLSLDQYFKVKWGDIKNNHYNALMERISDTIVEVRP